MFIGQGAVNNISSGLTNLYVNGDSNPLPNNGTTNTNAVLWYGTNGEDTAVLIFRTNGTVAHFRLNQVDYVRNLWGMTNFSA